MLSPITPMPSQPDIAEESPNFKISRDSRKELRHEHTFGRDLARSSPHKEESSGVPSNLNIEENDF